MKNYKLLGLLFLLSFSLVGCNEAEDENDIFLDRPEDTNLEFWITQRTTPKELENKGCTFLPGCFGGEEYLDSRYSAVSTENMSYAPEVHVIYLITGYPDTLDESAITRIEITDPSITVYGLTLRSTDEEIRARMKGIAYSYAYKSFAIKNCSFVFSSNRIQISVPVTNNQGVVY